MDLSTDLAGGGTGTMHRDDQIDTPSLIVDLDVVEHNVLEMAEVARRSGVALRPHVKTHKAPEIARMQIDAGARGIAVAKLGEAEVMADAGMDDILIAYPIVGSPSSSGSLRSWTGPRYA